MGLLALPLLVSCSNLESDAQKIADLRCESIALAQDSNALEKNQALLEEIENKVKAIYSKYTTPAEVKELTYQITKATSSCD